MKLEINNSFGDITIREIKGVFNLNKHSGNIKFKGEMLNLNQHYFETKFGTIEIWLKQGKGYELKASTGNFGKIISENNNIFSPVSHGKSIKTSIDGGGRKVKLKTASGEIMVYYK